MFTLAIANGGDVDLSSVILTDSLCDGLLTGPFGGQGADEILIPGEVWLYICALPNVQTDVTNVAKVTAIYAGDLPIQANDEASVLVNEIIMPKTEIVYLPIVEK